MLVLVWTVLLIRPAAAAGSPRGGGLVARTIAPAGWRGKGRGDANGSRGGKSL
ncbi:hypothetical protein ACFQU7_05435 [Pseudoroseomonas wenyumeiae]